MYDMYNEGNYKHLLGMQVKTPLLKREAYLLSI